jgi:hypothetical protein
LVSPAFEFDFVIFVAFGATLETCVIFLGESARGFSFATVARVARVARVVRVVFTGCASSSFGWDSDAEFSSLFCFVDPLALFTLALTLVAVLGCDRTDVFFGAASSFTFTARFVVVRDVFGTTSSISFEIVSGLSSS